MIRIKWLVLAAPVLTFGQSNWPDFHGPYQNGHGFAESQPPTTWSESENIRWETPVHGKACSSPVVWGDQAWLTTASENGKTMSSIPLTYGIGE